MQINHHFDEQIDLDGLIITKQLCQSDNKLPPSLH